MRSHGYYSVNRALLYAITPPIYQWCIDPGRLRSIITQRAPGTARHNGFVSHFHAAPEGPKDRSQRSNRGRTWNCTPRLFPQRQRCEFTILVPSRWHLRRNRLHLACPTSMQRQSSRNSSAKVEAGRPTTNTPERYGGGNTFGVRPKPADKTRTTGLYVRWFHRLDRPCGKSRQKCYRTTATGCRTIWSPIVVV